MVMDAVDGDWNWDYMMVNQELVLELDGDASRKTVN